MEEDFIPPGPQVLVRVTSWEAQDQMASPKITLESLQTHLELHRLMNVKLQKQSQSLLPGKLSTEQGGRKGPALLNEGLTF